MVSPARAEPTAGAGALFSRVVCGVDWSEAGETAARLAARVAEPHGSLTLVSVADPSLAAHSGWPARMMAAELVQEADLALERGRAEAAQANALETQLLEGDPLQCLLDEITRREASLAVVGNHGRPRAVGIAVGSVATHLLHESPCSVLVARAPRAEEWPGSIVVGVDGSPESVHALAAARALSERFGSTVRVVAATGDGNVDLRAARRLATDLELLSAAPVHELHMLSEFADLVVVGSRGLKGLRALGSVSERIAHEALCSVLVVRHPQAQQDA